MTKRTNVFDAGACREIARQLERRLGVPYDTALSVVVAALEDVLR